MFCSSSRVIASMASVCVAISLLACGGGGGGGITVTPVPMVTIGGVAAKGILKNGIVQIYSTDISGNISEKPIATTRTDASGAYTVSIPAQSSAVLATVTPALDNTTKVANDLKPDQADSSLPADFKMSAVIGGATTDTELSINPYSSLAVESAKKDGKLLSSHANITNQYVKTYLLNGIDPVATRPSMSTKSNNPNELAMTAALLGVAVAAESDTDCTTYATTGERYNCIIAKVSTAISVNTDTTVAITNSQALSNLNAARKMLTTVTYESLVRGLGVETQVTALANDEGLSAVISGTTKTQNTCSSSCGTSTAAASPASSPASAPTTATLPILTLDQYVDDLKRALKNLNASIGNYNYLYQYTGFNYFQQLAVHPTLGSIKNIFEFISKSCGFGGLDGTSTCQTGPQTLTWGTIELTSTTAGAYAWTGNGGGHNISGSLELTTDINSATFNLVGTIPNTDSDLSIVGPIKINFGITVTKKEDGKYTANINNSTVKYPESTAIINGGTYSFPKFSINLNEVTLDSSLFSGAWTTTCDPSFGARCVITTDEKFWVPESINGTITLTDSWGDYGELKVASKLRIPSQTQWTAMSGYSRYLVHKNPIASEVSIMGTLSYVGIPSWYWGYGSIQISANWKADFSGIDRTRPYSETNFPTGSLEGQVRSSQSGSNGRTFACAASDACIDILVQRLDYEKAKPSLSIYAGDFDKITIVPDSSDNSYALNNNSVKTPSRLSMDWVNFKQDSSSPINGLKVYSSNHSFVLTLTKDTNGKFKEGVIQDKDKKTVGVVKGGLLYINGQVYSLL